MKKQKRSGSHPLAKVAEKIEEQEVLVFDNVNSLPIYGEPYISPYMVMVLNHKGTVKLEYDMKPATFDPNEIAVIYPNHILLAHDSSDDYQARLIVISSAIFDELKCRSSYRNHLDFHRNPAFQLNEKQVKALDSVIDLLHILTEMTCDTRRDMIVDTLGVFFMMLDSYKSANKRRGRKPKDVNSWAPGELLFTRFYDALVKYHCKSHEVKFYASLQNLSPKYFSTVIKKVTGNGANEWISHYLTIQAKTLLDKRKDLTIQQVGRVLGFTDQATFSRHFKVNSGLSPSEYRIRNAKQRCQERADYDKE